MPPARPIRDDPPRRKKAGDEPPVPPPPAPIGEIQLYSRLTIWGRRWFWRARADNGEIVASGEPYNSAAARNQGVRSARQVLRYGRVADTED